jgi:GNAT superfamily N-acetyltransferase
LSGLRDRHEALRHWTVRGEVLVARASDAVVGFAVANWSFFAHCFIALVVVHPDQRRRGIASALIRHVEAECPSAKLFTSTNRSEHHHASGLRIARLDDFALEPMSKEESKDVQLFLERTGRASMIISSNRDTAEWLAMFDDVLLAQSAVDRFKNAAYDFVIEGESYRPRLKPTLDAADPPPAAPATKTRPHPRSRRR